MARPLRLHVPGMVYHVISRGNARQTIFTDDHDCRRYLDLLQRACDRFEVRCLAYCLMGDHMHLLLQPAEIPLSRMLQQLNSAYCQWFNRRHNRIGHVLQGRYKALMVETPDYFLTVLRYIMLNPVKARCVQRPSDWQWSSYRATAGLDSCPRFLRVEDVWGWFNCADSRQAQEHFAAYVDAPPDQALPTRVLILGSEAFVRRFRPYLSPHRVNPDFVHAERFATRPPLAELIRPSSDRVCLAAAARSAFREHAYTLREIGIHVHRAPGTIWTWINRPHAPGRASHSDSPPPSPSDRLA